MPRPALEESLRALIKERGRITFAEFQQACLYSPLGGFYSTRSNAINSHFHTSPTSHPTFGALIARQLEQMWVLLGGPSRFHVIEVGSGDGALARSIVDAAREEASEFAMALTYVAADYAPVWPTTARVPADRPPIGGGKGHSIQRVKAAGLAPFRGVTGCVLSNELLDNFPVHRFAIEHGQVREVFVAVVGDAFVESLGEPSTPAIAQRLEELGVALPEGARGEVNLAMEGWLRDVARVLDRGFVLTIDYGDLAPDLYSPERNPQGTVICFREHGVDNDPYGHVGEQDITTHVDFSSLQRLGEVHGLAAAGYTRQGEFLENLGFSALLEGMVGLSVSDAHAQLRRIAMNVLIDPDEMGDFKVLAQTKGLAASEGLTGFRSPSGS